MKNFIAMIKKAFSARHASHSEQVIFSVQRSLEENEAVLNLSVYASRTVIDRLELILKNDVYTLMAADAEKRMAALDKVTEPATVYPLRATV